MERNGEKKGRTSEGGLNIIFRGVEWRAIKRMENANVRVLEVPHTERVRIRKRRV